MAGNRDVALARQFHDRTAHTPYSVHASDHTLDWDIQPFPFKLYTDLPAIPLPREVFPLGVDTLAALGADRFSPTPRVTVDHLATLFYFAAGVTKKKTYPGGGEVLFRAAPSTGALYQTEVYAAIGAVEGLEPGLYHFSPGDFAVRLLRRGDVRAALADAAAEPAIARHPLTVVLTAIFWRNTWKYQARGWRHLYWDSGTMLANLIAVGAALGLAPWLLTGFVDDAVNELLGLDPHREAALELVVLGSDGSPAEPTPPLPAIEYATLPLSSEERDYPAFREMQHGSRLTSPTDVHAWRANAALPARHPRGPLTPLPPARSAAGRGLGDTIQHRGSSRQFSREPLGLDDLTAVLWWATRPVSADVPAGLVDPYLIINGVDSIAAGAWRYWPDRHALELIRAGDFRNRSAYLCLEQALGGDAAAVLYFLAPLDGLLTAWGNRGYRLANLEAGLMGGRAYLAAYAQRFGASGLTFYDREVREFFAPHAEHHDAIFVTALGRAAPAPW